MAAVVSRGRRGRRAIAELEQAKQTPLVAAWQARDQFVLGALNGSPISLLDEQIKHAGMRPRELRNDAKRLLVVREREPSVPLPAIDIADAYVELRAGGRGGRSELAERFFKLRVTRLEVVLRKELVARFYVVLHAPLGRLFLKTSR